MGVTACLTPLGPTLTGLRNSLIGTSLVLTPESDPLAFRFLVGRLD